MATKDKLYFGSIDDTFCTSLEDRLIDASYEGLTEITLVEAIPDNGSSGMIWCTYLGEVEEKNECRKTYCSHYESKSGRGKCKHRGNLYLHGEEVTFQVPKEFSQE